MGRELTESTLRRVDIHDNNFRSQLRKFLRHQQSNTTAATRDQHDLLALDEFRIAFPIVNDRLGELVVHRPNNADSEKCFQSLNETWRRYHRICTRWEERLKLLWVVEDSKKECSRDSWVKYR